MKNKRSILALLSVSLLATPIAINQPWVTAHTQDESHDHDHDHDHDHEKKDHQHGIFEDKDVKDRELSDWDGEWQSVFPYLTAGDLDEVMKHKAEHDDKMTAEEYKAYYTKGYETTIDKIDINSEDHSITFHEGEESYVGYYESAGHEILTYESGKKGVRYLFTATDQSDEKAPKYIQFSDHEIAPTKAHHFHIFMGNSSHEEILEEMENWPTYYPANLTKEEIVQEMLAH